MAYVKTLQSTTNGNPVYIGDLTQMNAALLQYIALLAPKKAFNGSDSGSVNNTVILSGFEYNSSTQTFSGGYMFFEGAVYGTADNITIPLGYLLYAQIVSTDERTNSSGVTYNAYKEYQLVYIASASEAPVGAVLVTDMDEHAINSKRYVYTGVSGIADSGIPASKLAVGAFAQRRYIPFIVPDGVNTQIPLLRNVLTSVKGRAEIDLMVSDSDFGTAISNEFLVLFRLPAVPAGYIVVNIFIIYVSAPPKRIKTIEIPADTQGGSKTLLKIYTLPEEEVYIEYSASGSAPNIQNYISETSPIALSEDEKLVLRW